MPITTLDPFGGSEIRTRIVTIIPNPIDSDVRMWVNGAEKYLTKKIGFHVTNSSPNTTVSFLINQTPTPAEYGYIEYTDYYYVEAEVGDILSVSISDPNYTTYTEVLNVDKTDFRNVTLAIPSYTLTITALPATAHIRVVNEANQVIAEGNGSVNASVQRDTLFTYFVSDLGYISQASSLTMPNHSTSINVELDSENSYFTMLVNQSPSEAETQFYSVETGSLYAWHDSSNNLTYYTRTSVPQVGDFLYNSVGNRTNKQITSYDPNTGITYQNV